MYYNVVVSDKDYTEQFYNQLVFHFYDDMEKALKFVELILKNSEFLVQIIPVPIDNEENE